MALAHNLGLVLRMLFGVGKPTERSPARAVLAATLGASLAVIQTFQNAVWREQRIWTRGHRLPCTFPTIPPGSTILIELPA